MMLEARDLSWSAGPRRIVDQVHLGLQDGECLGLIGPNGSGKSTLLRMLYRVLRPDIGCVLLEGRDIQDMTARQFAAQASVLAQESPHGFDFTVREAVLMGRIPHQSPWAGDSVQDLACMRQALAQVGASSLEERSFSSLSGGEKQRVLVARALAQQPRLLLLDEPTNHLDIRHQLELMALVRRQRVSSIVALHDLNIAAHYCDRLHLMEHGRIVAQGTPAQVLTPATIRQVYGVAAEVDIHAATGRLRISFIPDENL
ncbi:Hemin import ATP-binding protein HmuV [Delftia tsuruhatensis]|uniref:ABC transporter ATP-binding protein n=1 Tax=Delftia tsuruhatensis TaxID=180282 RepID=UPI001E737EAD|nr:ABC transporter ATP-binding protein [Delftia tsuruhatensis]CAB5703709.1 Hemin import ATP-binding protein HmuV [Delftia tsuruhatensis]CAC9684350.1 Hemin import ATP-binding protein HmuV [Delftia tsuruhatensis]